MTGKPAQPPLKTLVWPMRLTFMGLWAERLARAFWPLWSLILLVLAALASVSYTHLTLPTILRV